MNNKFKNNIFNIIKKQTADLNTVVIGIQSDITTYRTCCWIAFCNFRMTPTEKKNNTYTCYYYIVSVKLKLIIFYYAIRRHYKVTGN